MMKPDDIVKVFGKVGPYLKKVLKELRSYESRVKQLAKDVNKLQRERKKVQNKVRELEKRHGRTIDDVVVKWLKDVDRVMCLYENFLEDEDSKYARFSEGYLPKPAIRYRLSVILIDITKRVDVLLQTAANFHNISYWSGPPSFDADFDNIRYEKFDSRKQTWADIVAALEDSNVGVIGVFGLCGVGKTSLIKEIAKKIKGNMFDEVIMVNVTSSPDIRSIQGQIADKLGMKLEEESENGRAARLRERLKNLKEKTLIILDNMVVKLDFNILGIPTANMVSSQTNHKTLMISSSELLLRHQTDGKPIPKICVEPLTKEEAVRLFEIMSDIGHEPSTFSSLAAQIANKCRGLPMTIVTTATALRKKSIPVWKDANQRFESQNLTAMAEFSTILSYGLLENEELKHTFLICSRMNDDALITDLVRYCIGLGLLHGIYTVREATDRVHVLVAKLKELSLLSNGFSTDRFTMQDVVRDAALSIASKQMDAFALTKGKLDEWPDKLERYTAISFHNCDLTNIMKEFPEGINCSRLRVFHLDNKDPLLEIPDNFFNGMKELRVLTLIGIIHLLSLPSSIKFLRKLRMLCLERCKLGDLSSIGALEKLRVLSLSGSDFVNLPVELNQLAKLQVFDISDCFKLVKIPAGLLSSLTSLEELYVGSSPIIWTGQGNASLSELRQLNQLTTLDIQIPKITHFPENLFLDKLDSYKIIIREFNEYPEWEFKVLERCEASRYLALQPENGFDIHHWKGIKILFERVENLLLGQLNDVDDIFSELNCAGFPYLKYLSIVSNSKVQSIINSKNQHRPENAFPELESLLLYEVNNMEHIFQSKLTRDSFSKLKIIKLKMCGQLKNVFFSSMIEHLSKLETMEVSDCKSLKEIVTMERDSNRSTDKIEFPELRSLTLQSLSEFIGFYSDDASTGKQVLNRKPDELFDEKVIISKLERMELSSIKFQKIWNDQPLTISYFQNLIHLDVNDCWNLSYLLSLSMSRFLQNLQSLFLSQCGMMESIFKMEVSRTEIEYGSIFPKLKTINLRNMKRLEVIWTEFPGHSFGKLDALIIEGCNKLKNVFPSYMVGKFQSVSNLKVTNCKSMTEIFDIKGCRKRDDEDMTNLQNIDLKALPKLEHVWNEDPKGILNVQNLKEILVQECLKLKHIFPVSIAMGLEKLECLEVRNCAQLKEIVSRVETNNLNSISFKFPNLTTARFFELPNLETFYGGTHELCCSILNDLSLEHCHKFKLFITETKPFFSPEEVIYNLKSMQIEQRDAYSLKGYLGNYRMHKLEEFQLSGLQDADILDLFLHINPNLKSLLLSNCLVEQLVPPRRLAEKSGVVPKLKSLKLVNLPSLEKIGFEEYKVLFRMLECLILEECPCLNVIAPSSESFTYLTNLEVKNCNTLSHLMTASTAKSLVQLTTMKVSQCKSMVTIVSEAENEKSINFRQLKEIELVALQQLQSFCRSIRCALEFPSLEKCVVLACDMMKSFTSPEQVIWTPVLKQVCVRYGREEQRIYWKGDLNFTIRNMHKNWALDKDNMLASNPLNALQSSLLKTFVLTNCQHGAHAIPTNLFTGLKNLEELEISSSTNVKVIFDNLGTEMKGYTFPLKKLTLRDLPNLKHVWDKDREGILSFQNLQEVCVTDCHNLKTLFPVELAKKVERLHKLEIRKCEGFVQIVQEENDATEEEFSFPCLNTLNLHSLPQLSCFYPGTFCLECPDLDHLEVLFCGNFETFESPQEAESSTSVYRQPLFYQTKANFVLESLKLDWKNTMMLCNGKFPEDMLHKLVELELDFDDVNEVSEFPNVLLEKAFNLEYLQIKRCRGLEVLFPSHPQQCEIKMPINMTTSAHSAVSFSNLKEFSINQCHTLRYLFTSSTARKLVHLEVMSVTLCKSMQEILAKEHEETASEDIIFERLNIIILDSLSSLKCFYSGSDTLQFPSLIKVRLWKCPKMNTFTVADVHAESFSGIQHTSDAEPKLLFHQGLNTTVKIIQRPGFFEAVDKNCFSDDRELQAALNSEFDLQNKWFSNLVTLKLNHCTLPYAIPSTILPHLVRLEELEVRHSNKVKVIFEMSDTETVKTKSLLKKLSLKGLWELTHVWETNSQGLLIFPNLKQVVVCDCVKLQTLFSASQAKNLEKLEELEIACCDKLRSIVEKEEGTPGNIMEKFVFPCLKKLRLSELPQVTYFYPETFTLECPSLNNLQVLNCDKLELFVRCESIRRGTSINRPSLISSLNAISKLWRLCLDWKHISALSSCFRSGQFNEDLKYLTKISLVVDAREKENPILPIEVLQKAPNLTVMDIRNCNNPKIFLAKKYKIGEDGMFERLQILNLDNVSQLWSIGSENSWLNTMCEKLQKLNIVRCSDFTTLVSSPSTVTFSCLKTVTISHCPSLQYLFKSSEAKTLMNLEEITVEYCESVKTIGAKEDDATSDVIEFLRLKTIALHSLPRLTCFYSGSDTLHLPSLIEVHITQCPNLEIFSSGVTAESFQGIQISLDPEKDFFFHQDLNATVQSMFQLQDFYGALDNNSSSSFDETILRGNVIQQIRWFRNLVTLKLERFTQPYAIPSVILSHLNKLEELEVSKSDDVEVIFDMNDTEILETACQLKVLTLKQLGELRTVWENNSQGTLIFSPLRKVSVNYCENLQTLFPASVAKNLKQLEELEIFSCHKLQGIVGKEADTTNVTEEFVFPRLQKLKLFDLPEVTYFYPDTFTLKSPILNKLSVYLCNKLELFPSAHPTDEDEVGGISINTQPLVSNLDVISNVKKLKLDWKQISALSLWFRSENFLEDLEHLNEVTISFSDLPENEKPMLPIEILHKALNLEALRMIFLNCPEIFLTQNPEIGEDGILGQLKVLILYKVSNLYSMESEDKSLLNTISEKLHELTFSNCPDLTTLVHSVSFSCLKKVYMEDCPNLQYLFTFSAAKNLRNLEEISVQRCKSVKEIVAKEGYATSEGIKFERLHTIVLESLASLICFYSGSETLHLPSLINLYIRECSNIKTFSEGVIDAESFRGIQISLDPDEDLLFHQDLNATVKVMFQQQMSLDSNCIIS